MEMLDYPSWRWGLSLIALTMALHAVAVVMMGIVAVKILDADLIYRVNLKVTPDFRTIFRR
jgi:hypothetical protein